MVPPLREGPEPRGRGSVEPLQREMVGTAERQKSTLKTAGVKANYCGWNAECRVRRRFRVPDAFQPVRTMAALPPLFRVLLGAILLMPNGTPLAPWQPHGRRAGLIEGQHTVMQILKSGTNRGI